MIMHCFSIYLPLLFFRGICFQHTSISLHISHVTMKVLFIKVHHLYHFDLFQLALLILVKGHIFLLFYICTF